MKQSARSYPYGLDNCAIEKLCKNYIVHIKLMDSLIFFYSVNSPRSHGQEATMIWEMLLLDHGDSFEWFKPQFNLKVKLRES